jgi:predicted DNA-binding protein YlxM (UPF0122 family)
MNNMYQCKYCGKEVRRFPCHLCENVYCSKECSDKDKRFKIDEILIYDNYFIKNLSLEKISKLFKISRGAILRIFKRNNWKTRNFSEAFKYNGHEIKIDKSVLCDLFINKKLTFKQISKKLNCSIPVIQKWIHNYKIPVKLEISKEVLIDLYYKQNKTAETIGEIYNCSSNNIYIFLEKYKLPRRTSSEAQKLINRKGENNPNWKSGISKLPYSFDWTLKLKYKIRTRDNFTCQCCGMTEEEHIKRFKRCLIVHHIDYNKQNCKENNLITLCTICNAKANGNRDYWFAFYKYIIDEKI